MKRKILFATLPLLFALAACSEDGDSKDSGATPPPVITPTITSTSLPRAERGTGYTATLSATTPTGTGPITWSLGAASASLPAGMSLSTGGALSGTPTAGGLFELEFEAENADGGVASAALDLVVYEPGGYTHSDDIYDTPGNDDYANATPLGALTMASPIVQADPLSLNSEPTDPDYDPADYFSFTTAVTGEIEIEVFFAKSVGTLFAGIHGDHKGSNEEFKKGSAGANGDDQIVVLPNAAAGTWFLKVEAQYKNGTANENAYTFRIRFRDLTINTSLVEHDTAPATPMNAQLQATDAGVAVTGGNWTLSSGTLPTGITLNSNGTLTGTPSQGGLFPLTVQVESNGMTAERDVDLRVYDSIAGDFWQRFGEHRYYDAAATDGDGLHHEHYSEAMVVAPHPSYGPEGAIYVIGGRVSDTVDKVYVFHTDHQADNDRDWKLEDIGTPLSSERQYLGAAYLQHTYGGYIYVVGGELYSNTAPSSGDYTRVVERMQVADGSGNALGTPGSWETLAELPNLDAGGRAIEGWAEFGLVANDAALDADDRLYFAGGRIRVEDSVGSNNFVKEYNDKMLMYEAPLGAVATGAWHVKSDTTPYTPRRFPAMGLINGRIFIIGGNAQAGTADYVEMYQPDPTGTNAALATAGSTNYPTLAEPVWFAASAVHNGSLYILNGWKFQGFSPVATSRLQQFTPTGAGTGGTMLQLTSPDTASGYHSAVFHDGKLWFITGRDSFVPTPRFSQRYEP